MTIKDTLTVSIDKVLKEDYKQYCKERGYKVSTRVSILIFKDMHYKEGEK
jgi:hypothetical protein